MAGALFTVGYQGAKLEQVVASLAASTGAGERVR
jgi:hypothetical protein